MPDETTPITLTVELKQANVILSALAELPWRHSNDLIIAVRNQMLQQLQPAPQNNVAQFTPGSVSGD